MKLQNNLTGDVLEVPPPDELGASVVRFNGRIVETVLYSDDGKGSVTRTDGRQFKSGEWAEYLVKQLEIGAWKVAPGAGGPE